MIEVGESEEERHASAVEGLLLIQDSQFAIDARWNANENRKYERYRGTDSSGSHVNMLPDPGKR